MMITRLMLSLRKAAAFQEDAWSFGESTTSGVMGFARRRGFATTGDEMRLDNFSGVEGRTQIRRDAV